MSRWTIGEILSNWIKFKKQLLYRNTPHEISFLFFAPQRRWNTSGCICSRLSPLGVKQRSSPMDVFARYLMQLPPFGLNKVVTNGCFCFLFDEFPPFQKLVCIPAVSARTGFVTNGRICLLFWRIPTLSNKGGTNECICPLVAVTLFTPSRLEQGRYQSMYLLAIWCIPSLSPWTRSLPMNAVACYLMHSRPLGLNEVVTNECI